jgi:hypothetical protein
MFNNTTSYPLLLIQSLDETGILAGLIVSEGEGTREVSSFLSALGLQCLGDDSGRFTLRSEDPIRFGF